MSKKLFIAVSTAIMLMTAAAFANPTRYEAQDAATQGNLEFCADLPETSQVPCKAVWAEASGGHYVMMREGELTFSGITVAEEGFYTIWANYSQTCDATKNQNLIINGVSQGEITFPATGDGYDVAGETCGPLAFERTAVAVKVKLNAGANTIRITKSWGWIDLDYLEVSPFESEPFTLITQLVTPNASDNAKKIFQFLRENFQKKVISGVMTGDVMVNNSSPACNIDNQPEMSHVKTVSDKFPAMMGIDFMHSTGKDSEGLWFRAYHEATMSLAEEIFTKGGMPIYCWHWKDPLKNVESSAFYTDRTDFNFTNAFTDNTYETFNTSSPEYIAMLADIDFIAGELKKLADKNIPILWRPLHEAAGTWFWWGAHGPKPLAQLWRFMFDRMVNHHGLNNLIWVWTTEENGRELEWYPGDAYVDIISRDWYPYPNQQAKEHGSLAKNFENIKSLFGTNKIIALAENGPIPHPDSLINDQAHWSWFMTWNRYFTNQVNTAADWNYVMNHDYVITLEDMAAIVGPSWANYELGASSVRNTNAAARRTAGHGSVSARGLRGALEIRLNGVDAQSIELFNLKGSRIAVLSNDRLTSGNHRFAVKGLARQMSFVRVRTVDGRITTLPVRIE